MPAELKYKLHNDNMTDNGQGTAWMDSLDPLFLKIAAKWMETMLADFGTDHWSASKCFLSCSVVVRLPLRLRGSQVPA